MINEYVMIVGLGEIGTILLKELFFNGNGIEVLAIDNSYSKVKDMNDYIKLNDSSSVDLCVLGDARDQNTLIKTGLQRCTRLILTLEDDANNLAVAQTAKRLMDNFDLEQSGDNFEIITIVRNNENKDLFELIGVNKIIGISDPIMNIVSEVYRPYLPVKILDVFGTDNGLFTIKISSESKAIAKKISEIRVPFNVIFLGKIDSHGNCELVNSDTVLNEDDLLILNTSKRHQNLLARYF